MTPRKKIIFFSIIAVVVVAIAWFVYVKNQASHKVESQNGNIGSLFPFTGTNATDYQTEPNSAAPENTSTIGNSGNTVNTNGNTTGNNFGNGVGGGSGIGGGNITPNILNVSDLSVNTGLNSQKYGLDVPSLNNNNSAGNGTQQSTCSVCNPYAGQITLTANGDTSTNLSSDGGSVELTWIVGGGVSSDLLNTTCTASSSNGTDWTGTKNSGGGTDVLNFPANTTSKVLTYIYTLKCSGIGTAIAIVNISGVQSSSGFIIPGSSIEMVAVNTDAVPQVPEAATVEASSSSTHISLDWKITLPVSYTGADPVCTASSNPAGLWTGTSPIRSRTTIGTNNILLGSADLVLPANTSPRLISNLYTVSCTLVGQAIVVVNQQGIAGNGVDSSIIDGSSLNLTVKVASSTDSGGSSLGLSQNGGTVELDWAVTLPTSFTGADPVCTASSKSDSTLWSGVKELTGSSTIDISPNTTTQMILDTFTLSCTRVPISIAVVSVSGTGGAGFIFPGSSIALTVKPSGATSTGESSLSLPIGGGDVELDWAVTLPDGYSSTSTQCTASAQPGISGWSGSQDITGSQIVTIPANTGAGMLSDIFKMSCTHVPVSIATVSVSGANGSGSGGIIAGSSLAFTVKPSGATSTGESSLSLPIGGGDVEIDWAVTLPTSFTGADPVCTASSQLDPNEWSGIKTATGTAPLSISPNTGSRMKLYLYKLSCTRIGDAVALVEQSGPVGGSTGLLSGKIALTINDETSASMDSNGGPANLDWAVTLPQDATSTQCTASSSDGSWSGQQTATGTQLMSIAPNTSTSTEFVSYTLSCTGMASAVAFVNVGISPDAFADRTPQFTFTANGGTNVMITKDTPVDLSWTVQNMNGNSCNGFSSGTGTSTDSFADWGRRYVTSRGVISTLAQHNLDILNPSLATHQAELASLMALPPTSSTSTTISTLHDALIAVEGELTLNIASTTAINASIASTVPLNNATIATNNSILTKNVILLSSLNSHLHDLDVSVPPSYHFPLLTKPINVGWLFSTPRAYARVTAPESATLGDTLIGSGWVVGSTDFSTLTDTTTTNAAIEATVGILNTASSTIATLRAQNATLLSTKADLISTKTSLLATKAGLQHDLIVAQNSSTGNLVLTDKATAQAIRDLQAQIADEQSKIDKILRVPDVVHISIDTTGTPKPPTSTVGPTATSFTETIGTDGSVLLGDRPIEENRIYTLKCGDLPAQSVKITLDNSGIHGGNNTGSTDPSLTFLANNSTTANIRFGDPVTLSWTVANTSANSCKATSDGSYKGWGTSLQNVRHVRHSNGTETIDTSGFDSSTKPGDYIFYTKEVLADTYGTVKAPTADVGTGSQTFTEIIGADTPITADRTYTMTCGDLSPQTVTIHVNTKPSIAFTADGHTAESVPTGTPVDLSWTVTDVQANSCFGTSSGDDRGGSNGNFIDWGAYVGTETSPQYGGDKIRGALAFDTPLQTITGGTPKPPKVDVGAFPQSFNETIGADGSITAGVERDYTLTCTGVDGKKITQTVLINAPDINLNNGNNPNDTSNNNPDAPVDPCDGDLDIRTAQIQLQNLISKYKDLTGIDYVDGSANNALTYNPGAGNGLIGRCLQSTIDDANSSTRTYPLTREAYDTDLLPPNQNIFVMNAGGPTVDQGKYIISGGVGLTQVEGATNPLAGWDFTQYDYAAWNWAGGQSKITGQYWNADTPDGQYSGTDGWLPACGDSDHWCGYGSYAAIPTAELPKKIFVGDLADMITIGDQSDPAQYTRFGLSLKNGGTYFFRNTAYASSTAYISSTRSMAPLPDSNNLDPVQPFLPYKTTGLTLNMSDNVSTDGSTHLDAYAIGDNETTGFNGFYPYDDTSMNDHYTFNFRENGLSFPDDAPGGLGFNHCDGTTVTAPWGGGTFTVGLPPTTVGSPPWNRFGKPFCGYGGLHLLFHYISSDKVTDERAEVKYAEGGMSVLGKYLAPY